ncbi:MAG TPA: glycosyltransferase [bacterium]|nr:glycosyltransferase [bacterium]HPN45610.1 glycosyltransferase [bacterium]
MDVRVDCKICVFTIHPDNDVRVFYRHCRSLQKLGMQVTLIAITEREQYEKVVDGIKVIGIPRWHSIKERLKTYFKISGLVLRQKADIYHFHDPDFLPFAAFLRLVKWKPFVYDIHEFYFKQIPMKFPNIWPLRQVIGGLLWFLETIFGMICGSVSAVYLHHFNRFSKLGCRAVWTPNYASLDDYNPEPVPDELWEKRKNTVIHSGTSSPSRGSLVLFEVARILKMVRPEIQVYTTKRYWAKIHEDIMNEYAAKPEYKDVLNLVPHLSGKELPKFIREAGVGLSLLQYCGQYVQKENVPSKFFEYMSQSVPIVASNMPSSYTYVENEQAGFVVQADDPQAYVDAILKIVDNPSLAREMGERGRKAFIEKFNWGIVEKNLGLFYAGMLKK